MSYIGKTPTSVPLGTSDLADNIVTVDKLATTLDLSSNTITLPNGVGGKVLQVIQATDTTSRTTTSNTFVTASSTLTVNITPSSASNKILVVLMLCGFGADTQSTNAKATVYRDATNIAPSGGFADNNVTAGSAYYTGAGNSVLDTPNTTSEITYQFYMQNTSGSNTARVSNGGFSSLTCYEIQG
jgi:hypothetical protein